MYTRRNIRWSVVFRFAWRQILVFAAWSAFAVWLFQYLQARGIDGSLPMALLGTIGVAVAFYIGFKNNQSYDRNWEARKIWGGIVNASRSWANLVLSFISSAHAQENVEASEVEAIQRKMIYRHLAWMHALRFQLRRKTSFGFQPKGAQRRFMQPTEIDAMRNELRELLSEKELNVACTRVNSATQLLRLQSEHLRQVVEQHHLTEEFRLIAMMEIVTELYALQGKCERIKNTPFPRQYAYFSNVFTWIFITLLPFGIVGELAARDGGWIWATVPLATVVSWMFYTMEAVGDSSEDPFENFINDVPMTALCRTIEIDLRQMMSEKDVPPPLKPIDDILM